MRLCPSCKTGYFWRRADRDAEYCRGCGYEEVCTNLSQHRVVQHIIKECTCDSLDLFKGGCLCGSLQALNQTHGGKQDVINNADTLKELYGSSPVPSIIAVKPNAHSTFCNCGVCHKALEEQTKQLMQCSCTYTHMCDACVKLVTSIGVLSY